VPLTALLLAAASSGETPVSNPSASSTSKSSSTATDVAPRDQAPGRVSRL